MITTMNKSYNDLFSAATKAIKDFYKNWIEDVTDYPKAGSTDLERYYHKLVNGRLEKVEEQEYNNLKQEVEEIYEELGLEDEDSTINSLEDYFSVIKTLSYSFDTNYQILPIDEPAFEINLNTRSIDSPKGNQIYAVVGDDLAENLYFKTDRYFDNTDLNDMEIAILVNTGTNKYLIPTSVRDITSENSKIIFGWPISRELTEKATTLEFAVRFYKIDPANNTLDYSLSTQTNKLIVKPSLDYLPEDDDVESLDTVSNRVANLLKNYDKIGTAAVLPPEFYYYSYEGSETADLGTDSNDDGKLDLTLSAAAQTTEDTLLYSWRRSDTVKGPFEDVKGEGAVPTKGEDYILIKFKSMDEIDKYLTLYEYEGGEYIEIDKKDITDLEKNYYIKGSTCIIDKPGFYYCTATAKNVRREKSSSIPYLEIPSPAKLTWLEDIQTEIMLTKTNNIINSITLNNLTEKYGEFYNEVEEKYMGTISIVDGKETTDININKIPESGINNSGDYKIVLNNSLNNVEEKSDAITLKIYDSIDNYGSVTVSINKSEITTTEQKIFNLDSPEIKIEFNQDLRPELKYEYVLDRENGEQISNQITEKVTLISSDNLTSDLYTLNLKISTGKKDISGEPIAETGLQYSFTLKIKTQ